MYPYGAPSVKCAVCQYITNVNMSNGRMPVPVRPNGTATSGSMPPVSTDDLLLASFSKLKARYQIPVISGGGSRRRNYSY
ncbi:putative transcription factor Znf-LSD family [Helianthus annuus]|uniref:Transcription factor Znf-LSD family n=1 Tax=Helianthus annuus TaxID=4232 RepID=A0A9K3MXR1_HELAN|nr:putative transcription factor Znf-LSD family [Helianthus annuus]KAJ0864406.1 putative transcription factor Znf-LSD family [Helianthus annuus]